MMDFGLIQKYFKDEMDKVGIIKDEKKTAKSAKGHLISKVNFKFFLLTKKPTKMFLYFCPSFKKPLKSGQNKR